MNSDDIAADVITGVFLGALYLSPLIVAAALRSRNLLGIALINLLLGWTVFGWGFAWYLCFRNRAPQPPLGRAWVPPYGAASGLSPDGRYWWDGAAWRDTFVVAPPFAQRSPDGYWWWDGLRWRPVPPPPVH